jgi:hypothetical protein
MLTHFIGCREFIFGGGSGMISIVRPEKITSRVDARRPLLVRIYHILYFIELWMINGVVTGFRGYNNRLEIDDVWMDDNCEY